MTISSLDCACEGVAASRLPRATRAAIVNARNCLIVLSLPRTSLVRERPHTEIAPDIAPQSVESLGLEHEEHDDARAEEREPQRGDEVVDGCIREQHAAERLH